jgi:Flp pilus assembly protein TadD
MGCESVLRLSRTGRGRLQRRRLLGIETLKLWVTVFFFSLVIVWSLCGVRSTAQSGSDFDRGMAEFRAGNYSSAATLFASAEAASPGTTDALLYQAKAVVHLQDFSGAEQALRAYVRSHRDSSDALYMLGFVLNRENRPADSLSAYTQAAAITPPSSDDLKIVGLDYVLLNDYEDAIKWLEKAVSLDKRNKDAWYYLGRAYYTKARISEARKAFQTILDLDPRNARAENNLGLIFESGAQPVEAMDAYRKAITWDEANPHRSEQPYVNLGSLLLEQGRTKDAVLPLENAVTLAPENAYCRLRLGTAYFRDGQMDKAQRELEKATELDPGDAIAHYQLGRLYKETHQLDRSRAEFGRTDRLLSGAAAQPTLGH